MTQCWQQMSGQIVLVGLLVWTTVPLWSNEAADLVVWNAKLPTVPTATAFAVRDGRFVAVGTDSSIRDWIASNTRVLDVQHRVVVPGFNDAHLHPGEIHPELSRLGRVACDPNHVKDMAELVAALQRKAAATPAGQWILGERYQDTKLGGHPTRETLDRASTVHPIYLSHSSGHVAAVNSLALELAKVNADTPDPRGGGFDRDEQGRPNGILREAAKNVVRSAGPPRPESTPAERLAGLKRTFEQYVRHGITSIQIAGTSASSLDDYRAVQAAGPPVRIYAMLRIGELDTAKRLSQQPEFQTEYLKVNAIKHFHGNSLSGQTCWLYEPYADRPDYFGIPPRASQEELDQVIRRIHQAGLQACIHSNGDREIDMVLDAIDAAQKESPRADARHRIEHASIVNGRILERVKELGVVLALHSYVYEHGDKMEAYGERRWDWMHANHTAMQMGIPVAGNSDSPVSAAIPLLRIQSMITRRSAEGVVYGAAQRVTWAQALHAWTVGSAYASFEESNKGEIKVGQLADFVVLSQDPAQVPEGQIKDILVDTTAIGGQIVFQREGSSEG
ncbi:MAG: amidohydrolase [Planctomycetales bacterium]|nr:amidohydrolase [Planctomycetales bacterium]